MLYNVHVSFNTFWKFLRPGNSAWDFFGVNFFYPGIFLVGILGFRFLPSFNHPRHLKSGVPPHTPFGMLILLLQYPHPEGA